MGGTAQTARNAEAAKSVCTVDDTNTARSAEAAKSVHMGVAAHSAASAIDEPIGHHVYVLIVQENVVMRYE